MMIAKLQYVCIIDVLKKELIIAMFFLDAHRLISVHVEYRVVLQVNKY